MKLKKSLKDLETSENEQGYDANKGNEVLDLCLGWMRPHKVQKFPCCSSLLKIEIRCACLFHVLLPFFGAGDSHFSGGIPAIFDPRTSSLVVSSSSTGAAPPRKAQSSLRSKLDKTEDGWSPKRKRYPVVIGWKCNQMWFERERMRMKLHNCYLFDLFRSGCSKQAVQPPSWETEWSWVLAVVLPAVGRG